MYICPSKHIDWMHVENCVLIKKLMAILDLFTRQSQWSKWRRKQLCEKRLCELSRICELSTGHIILYCKRIIDELYIYEGAVWLNVQITLL